MSTKRLEVKCPDCGSALIVDAATGEIVTHAKAGKKAAPGRDFDSLLAGLGEAKNRAEQIFEQQVNAVQQHDRLMDEKFREALKRAEEDPDKGPPPRPWDLE